MLAATAGPDPQRLSGLSRKYLYCKGATERQVRLIRHNVVVHEGKPKIRLGRVMVLEDHVEEQRKEGKRR